MESTKLLVTLTTNGDFEVLPKTTKKDILYSIEPVLLPINNVPENFTKTSIPGMDDIVLCFRYRVDTQTKTFVTRSICKAYNISVKELMEKIDDCTTTCTIHSIDSCLCMPDSGLPVYVLTNEETYLGAGLIVIGEVVVSLLKKFNNSDFYIIPSSIHEVLVIPAGAFQMSESEMLDMVKEVNRTQVSEEDFLADHVYKVSSADCSFSTI